MGQTHGYSAGSLTHSSLLERKASREERQNDRQLSAGGVRLGREAGGTARIGPSLVLQRFGKARRVDQSLSNLHMNYLRTLLKCRF